MSVALPFMAEVVTANLDDCSRPCSDQLRVIRRRRSLRISTPQATKPPVTSATPTALDRLQTQLRTTPTQNADAAYTAAKFGLTLPKGPRKDC